MEATSPISGAMSASRTNLSTVIRDTGRRLLFFIRARVSSEADAEDVLQDVWSRLLETLEDGPVEQVGAWLYTVARNRIIDGYRKQQPASLEALTQSDDEEEHPSEFAELLPLINQSAQTEQWRDQFWAALSAALGELPPEQRQVFIWHEIEVLSFKDIAGLTGENQNTLLARKRYAVLHLRQRLAPWLNDSENSNQQVP